MNPSQNKLFLFFLSLSLGVSGHLVFGQAQELKWKLKPDDQFEVRLVQTSTAKTNVDSRDTQTDNSTTIVFDWKVTKVAENGDATIEQSLKSIKLLVGDPAVPAQAISYDTSSSGKISKESQKLLNQVTPLIGLRFDVVMSPLGEIKTVSLPAATEGALNLLPATMKLRALFSDKGLKDILGASVVVLPSDDLGPGGTWTNEALTPTAFGDFNRIRTYTVVGNKTIDGRDFVEFKLKASMEPVDDGSEGNAKGASLKGSLVSFSGSGTLMLDVEGGYFSSSDVQNRAESEKPYREKTIKTVVTNQIEMTIRKK